MEYYWRYNTGPIDKVLLELVINFVVWIVTL